MSKIEEIRKRVEGWAERRSSRVSVAEFEAEADQAQQDRATLLAALDGEWQSKRPEAGSWWCALALDQRTPTQSVLAVDVDSLDGVWTAADEDWLGKIIEPQFTGALWQRRTVPADPFADREPVRDIGHEEALDITRRMLDRAKKPAPCQGGGG